MSRIFAKSLGYAASSTVRHFGRKRVRNRHRPKYNVNVVSNVRTNRVREAEIQKQYKAYLADCQRIADEYRNTGKKLEDFSPKERKRLKYYCKHGVFPPFVVL